MKIRSIPSWKSYNPQKVRLTIVPRSKFRDNFTLVPTTSKVKAVSLNLYKLFIKFKL